VFDPLITLTTDFGDGTPYVAAMKGVILSINPEARLIDLSHRLLPQDLTHAAFFVREALPFFPPQALHVIVVDPGVGTERALLYVEVGGTRLLAPDNGVWTLLAGDEPPVVRRLANAGLWRPTVSHTFHGRDILAPVAAQLSLGAKAESVGPITARWESLHLPTPTRTASGWHGEVVFVDNFGNLITNLRAADIPVHGATIQVADRAVPRRVRAYGEAAAGNLVALESSSGWLEIAVVNGNAAERLGLGRGATVGVAVEESQLPT
jgi:S-adenosylmethionine hydrolase